MTLPRHLLNLLYQLVVDAMERSKGRAIGYNEDLIELEKILHKVYENQKI